MIRKPFAAFGRVLYANYYDAGSEFDLLSSINKKTVLFFSEGSMTVHSKDTGEVTHTCGAGWFNYGDYIDHTYKCTANSPTVCWCYDPEVNDGYIPQMETLIVKPEEQIVLPKDTKLFLCYGTITNGEQSLTGPCQVILSGDKPLKATTNVYGLIFK
jgi:hypothetical protein